MRKKRQIKYYGGHVHKPRCVAKAMGSRCCCGLWGQKPIKIPKFIDFGEVIHPMFYTIEEYPREMEKGNPRLCRKINKWRAMRGREILIPMGFKEVENDR